MILKLHKIFLNLEKFRGGGQKRGIKSTFKYALIGLAPYSFHYDESKTYEGNVRLFQYYFALRDFHNWGISIDKFESLFKKEFLNSRLSLENFDVNNVYLAKFPNPPINFQMRIKARDDIDEWSHKNYPETRDENIKILNDYLTLLDKNNIRPILFTTPFTTGYFKYFNREILEEFLKLVQDALINHQKAVFFDGFKLSPSFNDADFKDITHLNMNGAAKFSAMLNSLILELEK